MAAHPRRVGCRCDSPNVCRTLLPHPVEVLHHGQWWPGGLEAVRRDEDGWRGFVRFSVGISATHLMWFTEDELRSAPIPDSAK